MSTNKNDGGPAFPTKDRMAMPHEGMSLRDYFIAHAPAVVPEWFIPTMPTECPVVPSLNRLTPELRGAVELIYDSCDEGEFEHKESAQLWIARRDAQERAQQEWQQMLRRENTLQWPIYWADQMLARRAC